MIKKEWMFLFLGLSAALSGCSGGEGGSGTNEPADVCAPFMSEASAGEVEIVVRNDRSTPVYLRNGMCDARFSLQPLGAPAGETSRRAELTVLDVTCDDARTLEAFPLDCFDSSLPPIAPGATVTFPWKGLLYERVGMPASCYNEKATPPLPSTCSQGFAVAPGMVEATIPLFANAMENCEGGCQTGLDPFEVKGTFSYPDEKTVTIPVPP
ncbi:hypothetical protein [Polyangium jinanense]|uniref:Lipoprotein n=1 Tax=Polyangium jinanense TaxID=2829994 RepID=A0A9X4AWN3_9BACT|nr:hypothetical protein [Polyangium jinanense]MDC3956461.1 hypothetical protein [Polyangium jinanense]MDC3985492.1 hypothetical protein [Polyangium jinanense]